MRGRTKLTTAVALVAAATGSSALVGFVLGLVWMATTLVPAYVPTGLLIATSAGVLEAIWLMNGRPRPPSIARQVPIAWARTFDPRVAAALYGARLGIGPLTVLQSWLWWGAIACGALAGPWPSTLVGATYGFAKAGQIALVGIRSEPHMPQTMGWLQRIDRRSGLACAASAVAIGVVFAVLSAIT